MPVDLIALLAVHLLIALDRPLVLSYSCTP